MSGMSRLKICFFLLGLAIVLAGCGDFFAEKPTELESKAVIRDIARVRENPHIGNPLPQVYREGPKRLKVEDGVKLFYFTKYQPVGDLTFSDKDPARVKQVHGYGGTIRDLGFKVSTNPITNQLIVHCATDEECDQVLAYLEKTDVPPIQVHIDCLILERFGDVTKDWETTLLIENLLGEGITLGADKYPKPAFPGASLREAKRSTFGLDFGYWKNEGVPGHQVRLLVDVLESRGYLKILMNPTIETVNGKTAQVQIRDNAPIELTVTEGGRTPYSVTDYRWVADTLSVTPYVYADGSIGLKTDITFGSKSKPEGVVQTPIITERSVQVAENRIQPGKSLIIGGMRKSENRSVVRGVPFLKDIPIIGILFSSKDFEENATEVIFILTPTISSGGTEYKEMADMVRQKFQTPDYGSDFDAIVTDPLGTTAYSQVLEQQAEQAESEMIRLQVQTAHAERQAQAARLRAQKAAALAREMESVAKESAAQIEHAKAQKAAAEAEQEAALKEVAAQQSRLTETQAAVEQVQAEAQRARQAAQEAQVALEQIRLKVQQFSQEAQKAHEEAQRIQQQLDELERQNAAEVPPSSEAGLPETESPAAEPQPSVPNEGVQGAQSQ